MFMSDVWEHFGWSRKAMREEFDLLFGQKNDSPGQVIGNHHHIEEEFLYRKEVEINFRVMIQSEIVLSLV